MRPSQIEDVIDDGQSLVDFSEFPLADSVSLVASPSLILTVHNSPELVLQEKATSKIDMQAWQIG